MTLITRFTPNGENSTQNKKERYDMKKTAVIWLSVLFSVFLFTSCAQKEENGGMISDAAQDQREDAQQEAEQEETRQEETQQEAFTFVVNGISIPLDDESADLVDKLGDYEYFEAPSCAFQGLDKIYTYHGFTLYTYEADGIDHVLSVVLTDDSVTTPEGIAIGSGIDEVIAAYGDDYTTSGSAYVYTKGKTTLSFIMENDLVSSIEYMALTDK